MSHNPNDPHAGAFALPCGGVLALDGPEAEAFAHAQFMSDVKALAPGHWHWSGWLTPKGRVIALFALLRPAPGRLRLWLPDHPAAALGDALRRYVFRAKVAITVDAGLAASAAFAAAPAAGDALAAFDGDSRFALDLGGDGLPRTLHLDPPGAGHREDPAAAERWRAADLRLGLPRLDPALDEAWTPQMLSLDRLGAYSVKKGCYPGQEIVARTHFLGQAKRGLVALEGEALAAGDAVLDAGGATLGQVLCAAGAPGARIGLAVLPLERGDGPLATARADAPPVPARAIAFTDGLRRTP